MRWEISRHFAWRLVCSRAMNVARTRVGIARNVQRTIPDAQTRMTGSATFKDA